jgi:methylase of polypeptide subunit release factors
VYFRCLTHAAARSTPRIDDREGIELLRDVLTRRDFTPEGFARALGEAAEARPDRTELPVVVRRMPPHEPVSTLVKLLYLGLDVERDDARAAFAPIDLERLAAMGVLDLSGREVRAAVGLLPIAGLLVAGDRFQERPEHHDHVGPVAAPTLVLASLTVRNDIDSALDVGTGSGFQALAIARHARRVVACDINPRALRFTEFNAALNGIENIETREGSLFEPVAGETFDLIVSNPPYVISPDNDYAFRDSGLPGDSFAEAVARGLPAHLNEGGFAHMLTEWVMPDEGWSAPLESWVEGNGCDSLLLFFSGQNLLDYAALWHKPLRDDSGEYGAAIDRWLDHYRESGIRSIGFGGIALRRGGTGRNWVQPIELSTRGIHPAHHHLLRLFAAQDLLRTADDERLLATAFVPADDARLEMEFGLEGGRRKVREARLTLDSGLNSHIGLEAFSLELVSSLDGRTPLRELLDALASEGVDRRAFDAAGLEVIRTLVGLGFVEPVA